MIYTNVNNVPFAIALWLADDTYAGSNNLDKKQISVTSLLKPMKQLILGKHAPEVEADVIGFLASRNGTAVHDAVELTLKSGRYKRAALKLGYDQTDVDRMVVNPTEEYLLAHPDAYPIYSEIRTSKFVGDWEVNGEFDLVINGQVEDLKNTKTYSYTKGSNDDKYIMQGSLYRWLNPKIITKDVMAINFIFSDWSSIAAATQSNYPSTPTIAKKYQMMSYQATELFVMNKLREIEQLMLLDLDAVEAQVAPCSDEELWRSESEFKYYSKPDAARATKAGFTTYSEAAHYMATEKKGVGLVKEIKGQVKACNYCKAFPVCKQKNAYILSGELIPTRSA